MALSFSEPTKFSTAPARAGTTGASVSSGGTSARAGKYSALAKISCPSRDSMKSASSIAALGWRAPFGMIIVPAVLGVGSSRRVFTGAPLAWLISGWCANICKAMGNSPAMTRSTRVRALPAPKLTIFCVASFVR